MRTVTFKLFGMTEVFGIPDDFTDHDIYSEFNAWLYDKELECYWHDSTQEEIKEYDITILEK